MNSILWMVSIQKTVPKFEFTSLSTGFAPDQAPPDVGLNSAIVSRTDREGQDRSGIILQRLAEGSR
jgi:hypothetical protein